MDLPNRLRPLHDPAVFDRALVVLLGLAALGEIWIGPGWDAPRGLATVMAVAVSAGMLLRRRQPLVVLGVLLTGAALIVLTQGRDSASHASLSLFVMLLITAYSAGAYTGGRAVAIGAALLVAQVLGTAAADPDGVTFGSVMFFGVMLGAPWTLGRVVRRRRASEQRLHELTRVLELERDERARDAVAEERSRIARELHDVVAHGVSVMTMQAQGGARMLDTDLDAARDAFTAIERTGRDSLTEMRRLLGMLRREDEEIPLAPQPSMRQLDVLARQVRHAGLPVTVVREGTEVPLPPGVDLSAFRIVQEALTNALKHAGPTEARVHVRYGERDLELEVVDSGAGTAAPNGTGHGLVGMRERVSVFGGDLHAGARPEGGYLVRVRLPLSAERP